MGGFSAQKQIFARSPPGGILLRSQSGFPHVIQGKNVKKHTALSLRVYVRMVTGILKGCVVGDIPDLMKKKRRRT